MVLRCFWSESSKIVGIEVVGILQNAVWHLANQRAFQLLERKDAFGSG